MTHQHHDHPNYDKFSNGWVVSGVVVLMTHRVVDSLHGKEDNNYEDQFSAYSRPSSSGIWSRGLLSTIHSPIMIRAPPTVLRM